MIENRFRVTDMHTHVYPEKIAAKAVAGTDRFYGTVSYGTGVTDQLVEVGKAAGTDHFLIHSVATTPHQVSSINRFIASEADRFDCVTGYGTLYPLGEVKTDIEEITDLGMKGVKMHPEIQGFKVDEDCFVSMLRLCAENGLTVLLHTGDTRYDCSNPNRLVPVLREIPSLKLIGAHFGGWSNWTEACSQLKQFPNFFVDVSSSLMFISPEQAAEVIHAYGADRVMYGTDYPMWDPAAEIERFMKLPLSDEERKMILYDNAKRILGIG